MVFLSPIFNNNYMQNRIRQEDWYIQNREEEESPDTIFSFRYKGRKRAIEIKIFDNIENNNYISETLRDSFKRNGFEREYLYIRVSDKSPIVGKETSYTKKVIINKKTLIIKFYFIRVPGIEGGIIVNSEDIEFMLNLIGTECYKELELTSFQITLGEVDCTKFISIIDKEITDIMAHLTAIDHRCGICKNFPDCTMTIIKNLTIKELYCPICKSNYPLDYHILVYKAIFKKLNPDIILNIPCCNCFENYIEVLSEVLEAEPNEDDEYDFYDHKEF